MNTALIALIISTIGNCLYAARNFFGKTVQLTLMAAATALWLFEYTFIIHSPTYTLIMSFTLVYLFAYHFRSSFLRFFKIDATFFLMILLIVAAAVISIITYEGVDSIYGIIIIFLDLFSVYMFSAQGLRYKNSIVSLLYCFLDFNLGNYIVVVSDLINLVIPIFTLIKHRKEKIMDVEALKEYLALIDVAHEARKMKRDNQKR